jgi:GNAT superfamily N-acetyltransferase
MTVKPRIKPLLPAWVKKPLKRLGVYTYNVCYCEKDLSEPFEHVEARIPVRIQVATEQQKDRIQERADKDERSRLELFRQEKDTCLVALDEDKIAGYTWYNNRVVKLGGVRVKNLPRGGAFMCGSVVYPEYRGVKLFQNIISEVIERLKSEDYRFLCNMVDLNNPTAIRARERFITRRLPVKVVVLPLIGAQIIGENFVPGELSASVVK